MKKMFHIIYHQGNESQSHNEVPPHPNENDPDEKQLQQQMLTRV